MTMQIRRYQGSDHDQVLCLHRVALAAIGADAGPGPWDDDLEQIEQSYLTVRGDFLVGILDDRVAAMGALRHIDQQTAELKRMRVSPSLNNKGSVAGSCTPWKPAPGNFGYIAVVLDTNDQQTAAIGSTELRAISRPGEENSLILVEGIARRRSEWWWRLRHGDVPPPRGTPP